MFKELAPLLRHRSVLFTVSHLGDDQFRVNVVPKKIDESENAALTIPVSVSGTAEDLDAQLADTLVNFVSSNLELKNTLDRAKADMAAAAKSAQAEARTKSKSQVAKKDTNVTAAAKPPSTEAPLEQGPESAKTLSLFEVAQEPERFPLAANALAGVEPKRHQLSDEDQQILAEINAERDIQTRGPTRTGTKLPESVTHNVGGAG
jgi:PRTRC genetic system protein E